jgi:hypothetical protein
MLPQGPIWQRFRQLALDTVPEGAIVPFRSPPTLDTWLTSGAYSVATSSNRQFVLHASAADIGAALLSDACYHLDHAAEHSIALRNQLAAGKWYSSAWCAVTFYYWAFFVALAITRLTGHTAWFVTKGRSRALSTLAPGSAPSPGSGPYHVECGAPLSANLREVALRKASSTRVHELVWQLWFAKLRATLALPTASKGNQPEQRLYQAQVCAANALGDTWPSDLRNLVNYTPGFAYGAVRRVTPVAVFASIAVDPAAALSNVVDRIEANASALTSAQPLLPQAALATRVLADMGLILDLIGRSLAAEVIGRRSIDVRWSRARDAFLGSHARTFSTEGWPFGAAA